MKAAVQYYSNGVVYFSIEESSFSCMYLLEQGNIHSSKVIYLNCILLLVHMYAVKSWFVSWLKSFPLIQS